MFTVFVCVLCIVFMHVFIVCRCVRVCVYVACVSSVCVCVVWCVFVLCVMCGYVCLLVLCLCLFGHLWVRVSGFVVSVL